ncbi:MAG: hypothetical protein ACR2L6_03150 [Gemmatimonadaceae bacterium]
MRRRGTLHGYFVLAVALATVAGACGDSTGARDITDPVGRMPASLEAVTPTAVTGKVGNTISSAPTVRVKDATGSPLAGVGVTFVTGFATTAVTTGADGTATFGAWTLGTRAGAQTLIASVPGVTSVVFTAAAAPGPAAKVTRYSGWDQVGEAGKPAGRPVARVVDAFDNPVEGVAVLFAVTAGGGSIDGAPATSDVDGFATSGEWILGAIGANAVVASISGPTSEPFSAIALPPEAERTVYVRVPYDAFDGLPLLSGAEMIVLTTVTAPQATDGFIFFAGVSPGLSWGTYTISDTGYISLRVVAGDWFAWADKPLSGWHTEEEVNLSVWVDGPDYYAGYTYRRKR